MTFLSLEVSVLRGVPWEGDGRRKKISFPKHHDYLVIPREKCIFAHKQIKKQDEVYFLECERAAGLLYEGV